MKSNEKVLVYAHHGDVTHWVLQQLGEFIRRDYRVIVATTNPHGFVGHSSVEVISRPNEGLDFGAWAYTLRNNIDLLDSNLLVLMNDSCIGPIQTMDPIFDSLEEYDYSIWGLTDNTAGGKYHLQSYMRAFSDYALENELTQETLILGEDLAGLSKLDLIMRYEVGFPLETLVKGQGCKLKVMYPYKEIVSQRVIEAVDDPNQYIYAWERLLSLGYPFVKKSLFTQFKVMSQQDVKFIKRIYGVDLGEYL